MAWTPTNANDVRLVVSRVERDETGTRTGTTQIASTAAIVVDDFSIDTEQDMEGLSGVGNFNPQGVSKGDLEHTFSFTVQGEDAELFGNLAATNGDANELEIVIQMEDYRDKLSGAYAGTRSLSGSSGDATEYEVSGMARSRDDNQ
jgi:hypothetical protein